MSSKLQIFSRFVAEANRMAQTSEPNLAEYGLEQLRTMLDFDCAWYGWTLQHNDHTRVYASSTIDMPHTFVDDWNIVRDQDLVAKDLRRDRRKVGLYSRNQRAQTDEMLNISERYGLRKWACAVHGRPDRATTFFVSLYRTDPHGAEWNSEEIQLLQCTVDHIFLALQAAFSRESPDADDRGADLIVDPSGFAYLGLARSGPLLRRIWSNWKGERIPPQLQQVVRKMGSHTLADEGLVVSSEPVQPSAGKSELIRVKLNLQSSLDRLSPREQQVASLLASGATHKEAACTLGSAPATVRNQTQTIYEKLGISSKAQLIDIMFREGASRRE